MKLSDYIVSFFEKQQVKDVFMVTGGGSMHLVDSFGKSDKIRYWCTHHEQAAAMAAEGYAKMKNDLCVVLTTCGPGATNAVTGVLDCYQDSTPVVFLSGQAKSKQTVRNSGILGLRQFGVQEADIIPIVQPITKYAAEVEDAKKIRYHLEKAVYEAKSGRPGPVWLSIPLDVQSATVSEGELRGFFEEREPACKTLPAEDDIAYVMQLLKSSKRPVIIGGHGIRLAGACAQLEQFAAAHGIPVVMPVMGIDILEEEHPCNIGRIGTKGTRAGNFTMQNADLILALGSRLAVSVIGHEYELFGREARVVVVDIDRIEHSKKTISIDRLICCDAKEFLDQMLGSDGEVPSFEGWLAICRTWKQKYPVVLPAYDNDANGINYYKFIELLNENLGAEMPVVSDAGSAFYAVAQAIKIKKGQRHITTGGTATMGFALPAALGISAAAPDSCVAAVTGEGSLMQNVQEMETLRCYDRNVKVFVMNNGGYFSIRQTQKKFFQGHFVGEGTGSGLSFPSMERLADAFGAAYYRLDRIQACADSLPKILREKGPALIEVLVTPDMEIMPTNASFMREDGALVSKPLEDMYPFLPRDEFYENMLASPVPDR